ncbi:putative feruloyl esterase B-2 [Podospora australis]|uniref:Carboxylic ester hydrolase n=1 Tax=Podospora australis TaxID=1536484 RepID=A0AAN7AJE6_9PEZI|nr:putative feruloyl esterase B-2 [Podospora australis]
MNFNPFFLLSVTGPQVLLVTSLSCSVELFYHLLPPSARVISATSVASGEEYGEGSANAAYPYRANRAPRALGFAHSGEEKDFGYRAMHGSVELGKAMTEEYYGRKISYSYYSGASTGGRQGLKEAMISPNSFNGLLIGAPAWKSSGSATDWMVRGTAYPSACLTPSQALTVQNIYSDFVAEGRFAFPGMELSSESQWNFLVGGASPMSFGDAYIQYFLYDDPSWHWTQWHDSIVWQADEADPGNCTADDYNMAQLRERGGKVLMYHGLADALIPPRSSILFYERVAEAMGGVESVQEWFRLFMVPGLQHVTGTAVDAPWYFAGAGSHGRLGTATFSTPGFEDARHDALLALMAWVENGTAVSELVATTWKKSADASSGVLRQRPLCPFPKRQNYLGAGDPDVAESFGCV